MFTLPPPISDAPNNTQGRRDSLPIISLPENSVVLNALLRLCYATPPPTLMLTHLLRTIALYDALDKYDMDTVLPVVQGALVQNVDQDSMVAYAFGCRHRIQAVITAAAKATHDSNLRPAVLLWDGRHVGWPALSPIKVSSRMPRCS